jgi:glycosyltransferase involved in cell wall biosynthesis
MTVLTAGIQADQKITPQSAEPLMKILFISPRPFGLMGTPGTYLLTSAYEQFADIRIIANKTKSINTPVVYHAKNRTNLYELEFGSNDFFEKTEAIIKPFDPDLIIVGNYSKWFDIVVRLKETFKKPGFVLDIKSPLIVDESPALYRKVQEQGSRHAHLLDLVMTRCLEDVGTWIPGCQTQVLQYPLGVKIEDYTPKDIQEDDVQCSRFVYVGAIHSRRRLDVMLQYISLIPEPLKKELVFDFYGSGPALKDLEQLTREMKLENIVTFKGFVDAGTLAAALSEYDAGVAWVPHDTYEYAPSLKLMEYMAAGLVPVAMDTRAHKLYAGKGFHIPFFSDTAKSFGDAINMLFERGFPAWQRQENLARITRYSWDMIATEKIRPVFSALTGQPPEKNPEYASNIFDRVLLWDLPLKPETPQPVFSSGLKVAGILGDRLFRGIDPDTQLLPLTPQNWEQVIAYAQPDFLLVESTWMSATGHWYMALTIPGQENDEILHIIKTARKKQIPTVFWMTLSHSYCPHFIRIARAFDRVYCADPLAVEIFAAEGLSSKILLPAIQPVVFNPVHNVEENIPFNAGILFDGWVDLFENPRITCILKKINAKDLNVFQTKLMMYKGQLKRTTDNDLVSRIKGTVMDSLLPVLLKNAGMYLAFDQGRKTRTQRTWEILEAAACRVPVAYLGTLDNKDMLHDIVQTFENEDDLCDFVNRPRDGFLHLEKERHKAWRQTFLDHVFSKRIQTICQDVNLSYDWEEFPRVSLVTGTMRPHLLPKCFDQYHAQTYPNKELILVFNGDAKTVEPYQSSAVGDDSVHVCAIPPDSTVGTLLNYGIHKASGKYFFRIDDDDHYGSNYILDTLLHLRAVKADIFGKRASFFHFEGEPDIYLRNRILPGIKTFPAHMLHKDQHYLISGCGFSGSVPFLRQYRFPDFIQASVDTALVERIAEQASDTRCLLVDNLNLIVERASDVSSHTWRIDQKAIKKRSQVITDRFEDLIF